MSKQACKPDRRVAKTKRAIAQALAQLLAEKDIDDISVKDIVETADISRKTFYNYYAGVHELVDAIEDQIVGYFAELIKETDFEQAIKDPSIVFDKLYETIAEHIEFVDALFGTTGSTSLMNKVISTLIEMTRDAAVEQFGSDPQKTEVIIRFIFAGEIAVYQAWYHSDRSIPIKELSQTVGVLCTGGVDRLLAEQ